MMLDIRLSMRYHDANIVKCLEGDKYRRSAAPASRSMVEVRRQRQRE